MKSKTPKREGPVEKTASKSTELKTESPISEKDEVKKAEDRTIKSTRKHL